MTLSLSLLLISQCWGSISIGVRPSLLPTLNNKKDGEEVEEKSKDLLLEEESEIDTFGRSSKIQRSSATDKESWSTERLLQKLSQEVGGLKK